MAKVRMHCELLTQNRDNIFKNLKIQITSSENFSKWDPNQENIPFSS